MSIIKIGIFSLHYNFVCERPCGTTLQAFFWPDQPRSVSYLGLSCIREGHFRQCIFCPSSQQLAAALFLCIVGLGKMLEGSVTIKPVLGCVSPLPAYVPLLPRLSALRAAWLVRKGALSVYIRAYKLGDYAEICLTVQRSVKVFVHGCEKFVSALAYLFCLALPGSCLARFAYFLANLCSAFWSNFTWVAQCIFAL